MFIPDFFAISEQSTTQVNGSQILHITAYNASMLFILLYHGCLCVKRLSAFHQGTCLIDRFARHSYTQNPAHLTDNYQLQHILAAFSFLMLCTSSAQQWKRTNTTTHFL